MESLAVLFLAVLLAGYFVLAGCDVGLGMLMPYVARAPVERRRLASAIAPYFLGSEVWLVASVGVVAGLFPELKSEAVTGNWPLFVALLAGWLWRDAGLWLRGRVENPRWHAVWDAAIVAGSWTIALSWGLVLASLLGGGELSPLFAPLCAVAVAVLFALRGAAFGAERLVPGDGQAHASDPAESADVAARATRALARAGLVAVLLAAVAAWAAGGVDRAAPALVPGAVLAGALAVTAGLSGPRWSRHTSALAMAALPLLVALGVELPVSTADPGSLTLVAMAVAPALPAMVIGQIWLYRMLRRPAVVSGFFA
ncbi:cytochrome d ubiquinol oxidase subunit II [Actinorugispora endophytica]|uniref:Cytochrome bd-type quinol oxidase subunit 2 n=1 Tax=Actinorugispora endophytica TaxID=1605990 RepID=A0A4R6UXZ5_9ACTN|nr:cytochrome d ubiquinol oxidase subunit II [Actinorugispora endophytica]TDQ52148.1 cytochrome bd-type quinol oxidase subunit 2 [Actinorugispora endophytica]